MFDHIHDDQAESGFNYQSAIDPDFKWPELPNPLPNAFIEVPIADTANYLQTMQTIISEARTYQRTLPNESMLARHISDLIARREAELLAFACTQLVSSGVEAIGTLEKYAYFLIFLVNYCGFSLETAIAIIQNNIDDLTIHTRNGDTLTTLSRIILTANATLPELALRQKLMTFLMKYLPANVPGADKHATLEVPIAQMYQIPTKALPYPFIDNDETKMMLFNSMIKPAFAEHQAQAEITVSEGADLSSADLARFGTLRGSYFGTRRGWLVPEMDIDRHDTRPETSHFELKVGPEDLPGYCRRLRIHPHAYLDVTGATPTADEVTSVLRSLDVMPFPNPEYYELDTDIREIAKKVPATAAMVHESSLEVNEDPQHHYPGTTEQVTSQILNYLENPTPNSDPIMRQFIDILAGLEPAKLNIIERLIPPFLKLDMPSAIKPIVGTAAMVMIMSEAAAEAFRRGETLWLFQSDADFKQHLEHMFGDSAVRVIAHISQVKRDTKDRSAVSYIPDDCFTMIIDIRQALANVLNSNNSPDGFGEFVLELISQRDPALANELRAEWQTTQTEPLSNLAITPATQYHTVES